METLAFNVILEVSAVAFTGTVASLVLNKLDKITDDDYVSNFLND